MIDSASGHLRTTPTLSEKSMSVPTPTLEKMMSEEQNRLEQAMGDLANASHGKMDFRGKSYATVALRVEMLRKHYQTDVCIRTRIVERTDKIVLMEARIFSKTDDGWRLVANGYAEEVRGNSNVNKTSALENCETSAIGRALACLGLGGGEFASADELIGAVKQQDQPSEEEQRKALHDKTLAANWDSVQAIKESIASENYSAGAEAWFEMDDDTKQALWLAPSKGGIFTTREREIMKTTEFKQAYYGEAA